MTNRRPLTGDRVRFGNRLLNLADGGLCRSTDYRSLEFRVPSARAGVTVSSKGFVSDKSRSPYS